MSSSQLGLGDTQSGFPFLCWSWGGESSSLKPGGWVPLISTFSTKKGQETLGPSCAESSRAQEDQVYIYRKANASAGVGLYILISKHLAGQAGR